MTKSRKKFDAAFKAKVALEAARGFDGSGVGQAPWCASEPDLYVEEAGAGRCREFFRAGRERLYRWRGRARAGASKLYAQDRPIDGREGFLGQEARSMSAPDRRAMVERPGEGVSVRRQCELLNVARSGVYRPKPVAEADDLALMRRAKLRRETRYIPTFCAAWRSLSRTDNFIGRSSYSEFLGIPRLRPRSRLQRDAARARPGGGRFHAASYCGGLRPA